MVQSAFVNSLENSPSGCGLNQQALAPPGMATRNRPCIKVGERGELERIDERGVARGVPVRPHVPVRPQRERAPRQSQRLLLL